MAPCAESGGDRGGTACDPSPAMILHRDERLSPSSGQLNLFLARHDQAENRFCHELGRVGLDRPRTATDHSAAASDWWNSVAVTAGYTIETTIPSGASSLRATADSMFRADLVAE